VLPWIKSKLVVSVVFILYHGWLYGGFSSGGGSISFVLGCGGCVGLCVSSVCDGILSLKIAYFNSLFWTYSTHFEWVSAEVLARIKSLLACVFLFKVSGFQSGGSEGGLSSLLWGVGVLLSGLCEVGVFVLEEWNEMYESSFLFLIGAWSFFSAEPYELCGDAVSVSDVHGGMSYFELLEDGAIFGDLFFEGGLLDVCFLLV
jgi:hypothetical protein